MVNAMILAYNCSRLVQFLHFDSKEQTKRVGAKVFEKILELVIGSFIEILICTCTIVRLQSCVGISANILDHSIVVLNTTFDILHPSICERKTVQQN